VGVIRSHQYDGTPDMLIGQPSLDLGGGGAALYSGAEGFQ
jgi:hypothetical protein